VLSSLGSAQVVQGYFLLDRDITRDPDGRAALAAESRASLARAVDRFAGALALHHGEGSARTQGYALTAA
jgi:FMN reductase